MKQNWLLSKFFKDDLKTIISSCPSERQTFFYSATLNQSLINLSKLVLRDAYIYDKGSQNIFELPQSLKLEYLMVTPSVKVKIIMSFLFFRNVT